MSKASVNNVVLAESSHTERVEGNHYFPPNAINKAHLKPSSTQTRCPWKGLASYYDVEVEGRLIKDAAWYYPDPKDAAKNIKDHVAFYASKVQIEG